MNLKCQFCNSNLTDGTTTIKVNVNGKSVFIQNIPAQICSNNMCGQELLVGNTVKKIEDVVYKARRENVDLGTVFDFTLAEEFTSNILEHA